ncbi:MAG: hypothetical protein PHI52_04090 [Bacteroidales bacterium]|nr:hypothetical protein [Bacteroidales bacterium]
MENKKIALKISTNRLAIIACAIWAFTAMNPFYLWLGIASIGYFLVFVFVFTMTMFLLSNNNLVYSRERVFFAVTLLFYILILMLHGGLIRNMVMFILHAPLLMIAFYPNEILYKTYELFRKIIIFFAIGAIIVFLISFLGFYEYLPFFEVEGISNVHRTSGVNLHVHGFIVTMFDTGKATYILRACGPLQEPGHFGIVLGVVMFIDRLLAKKMNLLLLFAGFLTFSPAFFIILFIAEVYQFLMNRKVKEERIYGKNRKRNIFFVSLILLFTTFLILLNQGLRNRIWYMVYERNFQKVITSVQSGESIEEGLNERVNNTGIVYYNQFRKSSKIWLGDENWEKGGVVLSDYRGMIATIGIVGLFLSLLTWFAVFLRASLKQIAFMLCIVIFIYLHRAWMFLSPYIMFLFFVGISAYIFKFYEKEDVFVQKSS